MCSLRHVISQSQPVVTGFLDWIVSCSCCGHFLLPVGAFRELVLGGQRVDCCRWAQNSKTDTPLTHRPIISLKQSDLMSLFEGISP